jgi:hypothetical protein
VRFGRVVSSAPISDERWGKLIDFAEALTIYYLTPPYNERRKKRMRIEEPLLIVNYTTGGIACHGVSQICLTL